MPYLCSLVLQHVIRGLDPRPILNLIKNHGQIDNVSVILLAQVLDCCTFDHMEPILNVIKKQAANLHPTALGVLVLSLFQMLTQASKLMPQVLNIGSEIIETFYKIRNETSETEKEMNLNVDKVFMFDHYIVKVVDSANHGRVYGVMYSLHIVI